MEEFVKEYEMSASLVVVGKKDSNPIVHTIGNQLDYTELAVRVATAMRGEVLAKIGG